MNSIVKRQRICTQAGFTFIELLIVLAIISILVAIAIPAYHTYELRAQIAEALTFLGDTKGEVNAFYARWGRMPANNDEAGLRAPDALHGKYVRDITVSNGVIVASIQLVGDANGGPIRRTLTFRPWVNATNLGMPIVWSCGERDSELSDGYHVIGVVADDPVERSLLPSVCRK